MQIIKFYKRHENCILALAAVLGMMLFVGLRFDYYYQANDDIYIKNILSGVYTGTPESHNIQMHYPISLLLSLLYRIGGNLPIYGLFLCACHYGACFLILTRAAKLMEKTQGKVLVVALLSVLFTGLLLPELVFMQYTVTCALLAGAAAFRFYTTEKELPPKAFIRANLSNILLVVLAFLVRSEMLLLLLPLICTAGLFQWGAQKPMFTKDNTVKYFSVIGLILAGLAVGQVIHLCAYSSTDWKTFTRFFDARTELYDYQFIPSYEENRKFYESLGLSESEQTLLENYNFGLDEEITGETLADTAAYADAIKGENFPFMEHLRTAFTDYKYKLTHEVDYPWNILVLAAYALLILLAWKNKSYSYIWKLPFLFGIRTGLWMYMILGNRYPERITHSLYFMEFVILGVLLLEQCRKERKEAQKRFAKAAPLLRGWQSASFTILVVLIFAILGTQSFVYHVDRVEQESERRDYANREIRALDAYCRQNPDNFYFVDVYSSVSCSDFVMSTEAIEYSEKAFAQVDNSLANYDLMGGWVVKSPLTTKKLQKFGMEVQNGISAMEQGLLDRNGVYVIMKTENETDWLTDYFASKREKQVTVEPVDTIESDGKELYTVYAVK